LVGLEDELVDPARDVVAHCPDFVERQASGVLELPHLGGGVSTRRAALPARAFAFVRFEGLLLVAGEFEGSTS
jgi:hypothetical protein